MTAPIDDIVVTAGARAAYLSDSPAREWDDENVIVQGVYVRTAGAVIETVAPLLQQPVRPSAVRYPTDDDVNELARILMAEWERAERKPVTVSYVATFADMARAALVSAAARSQASSVETGVL